MIKLILLIIVALLGGFMQSNFSQPLNSVEQSFSYVQSINILNNNEKLSFKNNLPEFNEVINTLNEVVQNSHNMPAFSVSLHNETINAIKHGVWIELEFDKNLSFNDMPFTALLIQVDSNAGGFNLIRKFNGKYEGRCFYLSLENTMQPLYEKLISLY